MRGELLEWSLNLFILGGSLKMAKYGRKELIYMFSTNDEVRCF